MKMELGIFSEILVGTRLCGVTSQARGNSVVTAESLRYHMLGRAVLHDAGHGLSIGVFYSLFSLFAVCLSSYALKLHALCYRSGWPVIGIV